MVVSTYFTRPASARKPRGETVSVEIDLTGETAVVTGAGSGIGREICLLFARAGADVLVVDLNEAGARQTVDLVTGLGRRAWPVLADVTDADGVGAGLAAGGAPAATIAVNNAFWAAPGPFLQSGVESDEKTLRVITLGAMIVSRAVLPAMLAAGRGSIINIMSDAGRVGEPTMVAYSAAKAGVGGFTKALAKEVGPGGVRVNAVSPGATRTPATVELGEAMLAKLARAYPLGRLGEPEDIAGAVLFLASPLSSWVTGQILSVSGGYTTV
jgi:NAD(P)-dependent dehydrogenase (short-subunit alcohol dehydrogenase family)